MLTTAQPGISSDKDGLVFYVIAPDKVQTYWESLEPMLDRAVETSDGMLTKDMLLTLLLQDTAAAFISMRGEEIVTLLICQKVYYATYCAIRIIVCVGAELQETNQFIGPLEAWAIMQGASELEGWCEPAMTRYARRFGWVAGKTRVVRNLRMRLQ